MEIYSTLIFRVKVCSWCTITILRGLSEYEAMGLNIINLSPIPSPSVISIAVQVKCRSQRLVQQDYLLSRKCTDEVSEHGFWYAYELVAVDTAVVFHALVRADRHLRCQPLAYRVDRSTDDG